MPGFFLVNSVTARARYVVMVGTCFKKFCLRRTWRSVGPSGISVGSAVAATLVVSGRSSWSYTCSNILRTVSRCSSLISLVASDSSFANSLISILTSFLSTF